MASSHAKQSFHSQNATAERHRQFQRMPPRQDLESLPTLLCGSVLEARQNSAVAKHNGSGHALLNFLAKAAQMARRQRRCGTSESL
jgi:hypothetical protein